MKGLEFGGLGVGQGPDPFEDVGAVKLSNYSENLKRKRRGAFR